MMLSPGTHERFLSSGGHIRRYLLHVPAAVASKPRPLVVMLHGAGADAHWTLEETRWDRDADREHFLVAVPEALPLDPAQPANFLKNPSWWNDGSPAARVAPRAVDDVVFLSALFDEIGVRSILVTGFSNGAAMTFRLAQERGESLSAIAPVAGYCWQKPMLAHPIPTCYLVGREDPLVPLEGGEVRAPWGWIEKRPPVSETIDHWRGALGETPFEVHMISGLGHHWPGGRGLLSRRLFGPPLPDLSANTLIWQFFQKSHREGMRFL